MAQLGSSQEIEKRSGYHCGHLAPVVTHLANPPDLSVFRHISYMHNEV